MKKKGGKPNERNRKTSDQVYQGTLGRHPDRPDYRHHPNTHRQVVRISARAGRSFNRLPHILEQAERIVKED
jgi:hypothetical protein